MRFFDTLVGTFHSAEIYRRARQSGGFMMGYALMVVLLCTFAVTIYYTQYIHREIFVAHGEKPPVFDDVVRQIAQQVPVMTVMKNEIKTINPTPTVITVSGAAFGLALNAMPLITIDTSGTATHETMKTPVLITNKDVIMKTDKKTEIKSIGEFTKDIAASMVLNRSVVLDAAEKLIVGVHANLMKFYLLLGGMAWLFIAAFMFVMRMVMLLALGVVGVVIGSLTKNKIPYAHAVGMASLSFTPVALFDTLLFTVFHYPTSAFVLLLAGSVALYAAMKASSGAIPTPMIG